MGASDGPSLGLTLDLEDPVEERELVDWLRQYVEGTRRDPRVVDASRIVLAEPTDPRFAAMLRRAVEALGDPTVEVRSPWPDEVAG